MSVQFDSIKEFGLQLRQAQSKMSRATEETIMAICYDIVVEARNLVTAHGTIRSGVLKNSFHYGSSLSEPEPGVEWDGTLPVRIDNRLRMEVYNNAPYAWYVEYGFRSHFVPGHWEGYIFNYQPHDPEGGIYVSSGMDYVPGRFFLKRALETFERHAKSEFNARIVPVLKETLEL
mgnify:CR=1 FL=1